MRLKELERLFAGCGLTEAFAEQEALFRWPQVVGERTARLTEPLSVREGVLYVRVGNHVSAQEYTLMREAWLQRLNARLKRPLKDIRFKVAPINTISSKTPEALDVDGIQLNEQELADVQNMVSEIADERVKRSFQKLIEAHKKLQKLRAQRSAEKKCPGCGLYHDAVEVLCVYCRLEGKTA